MRDRENTVNHGGSIAIPHEQKLRRRTTENEHLADKIEKIHKESPDIFPATYRLALPVSSSTAIFQIPVRARLAFTARSKSAMLSGV